MVVNRNTQYFFDGRFNVLNPWVTKFEEFTRINTNEMIVLFGTV